LLMVRVLCVCRQNALYEQEKQLPMTWPNLA
jgi:hypothetical protein